MNRPLLQPAQFEITPRKRRRSSTLPNSTAAAAIHNIPNVKVVLDFREDPNVAPTSPADATGPAVEAYQASRSTVVSGTGVEGEAAAVQCKPASTPTPTPTPTPTTTPKVAAGAVESEGGWTAATYMAIGIAVVSVAFVSRPELFRITGATAGQMVRGFL